MSCPECQTVAIVAFGGAFADLIDFEVGDTRERFCETCDEPRLFTVEEIRVVPGSDRPGECVDIGGMLRELQEREKLLG